MIPATNDLGALNMALAAMTDERDHYKRELGLMVDRDAMTAVAAKHRLTSHEAKLLMALHARPGRVMSDGALLDAMYGGVDEPNSAIIGVFVCKLRAKIGKDKIATLWGHGWSLTEAGVALVAEAMNIENPADRIH